MLRPTPVFFLRVGGIKLHRTSSFFSIFSILRYKCGPSLPVVVHVYNTVNTLHRRIPTSQPSIRYSVAFTSLHPHVFVLAHAERMDRPCLVHTTAIGGFSCASLVFDDTRQLHNFLTLRTDVFLDLSCCSKKSYPRL